MTRIVADTLCGLSLQAAHDLGIPMISQVINFGENRFARAWIWTTPP